MIKPRLKNFAEENAQSVSGILRFFAACAASAEKTKIFQEQEISESGVYMLRAILMSGARSVVRFVQLARASQVNRVAARGRYEHAQSLTSFKVRRLTTQPDCEIDGTPGPAVHAR